AAAALPVSALEFQVVVEPAAATGPSVQHVAALAKDNTNASPVGAQLTVSSAALAPPPISPRRPNSASRRSGGGATARGGGGGAAALSRPRQQGRSMRAADVVTRLAVVTGVCGLLESILVGLIGLFGGSVSSRALFAWISALPFMTTAWTLCSL